MNSQPVSERAPRVDHAPIEELTIGAALIFFGGAYGRVLAEVELRPEVRPRTSAPDVQRGGAIIGAHYVTRGCPHPVLAGARMGRRLLVGAPLEGGS